LRFVFDHIGICATMLKLSPSVLAEDVTYYPISYLLNYLFELFQKIIIYLFSPNPPRPDQQLNGPRIAVIGAGVTGVSAAAHCVSHGCDVVLFESRPRENLGGIWSRVNSTSSLQIYSVMYRFHPSVTWHKGFPSRGRILEEVEKLWHRYHLAPKTRFDTAVTSVSRANDGKWIVKGERQDFGAFDGIIASIGTCGEPSMPHLPGQEQYEGQICHSSRLDGVDVRGKNVVIVGGGASAIEAVEYAVAGQAERVDILSRVSRQSAQFHSFSFPFNQNKFKLFCN